MPISGLVQAVSDPGFLDQAARWISQAAILFVAGFCWKINSRMGRIETILSEPNLGIIQRVDALHESRSTLDTTMHTHGIRLDGHDREIGEIKEDRRHTNRRESDRNQPRGD